MKKNAYWFLVGFVIWCMASALWYLLDVKGVLISDPKYFNATNRFVAIAEILFMLLGACLFGFAIAWWLKQAEVSSLEISVDEFKAENQNLAAEGKTVNHQFQSYRAKSSSEISAMKLKLSELRHEVDNLKLKSEQEGSSLQKLKLEKAEKSNILQEKIVESEKITAQLIQVESARQRLEQTNMALDSEVRQLRKLREEKSSISNRPLVVKTVAKLPKDDLTKIKGIGPFIEKRLNMVGIYNFKQLSELEPEMLERVGAAIEFFPDRILRENWIGQAKMFASK